MVLVAYNRTHQADHSDADAATATKSRNTVYTVRQTALKFAFRVHQFAGGFDDEATRLFNELHEAICDMQD